MSRDFIGRGGLSLLKGLHTKRLAFSLRGEEFIPFLHDQGLPQDFVHMVDQNQFHALQGRVFGAGTADPLHRDHLQGTRPAQAGSQERGPRSVYGRERNPGGDGPEGWKSAALVRPYAIDHCALNKEPLLKSLEAPTCHFDLREKSVLFIASRIQDFSLRSK